MIGHNEEQQDKKLKEKIIFAIQELGGEQTIERNGKKLNAYLKGRHCEESVKDLIKFIRVDAPENPKALLILADYNIV